MRQNNPLLYIFVGMPESAVFGIQELQSRRVDTKGVGYLSVDGEYTKERLLDGMRQVQSRFLTKIYVTSGEIKVVYVVDADAGPAAALPEIKADVEGYLHYLYPGGVLTDIFLVLDDAINLTAATQRGAVIDMLSDMRSESTMLYLLSNVNSRKLYEDGAYQRILQSIAFLGIMKDFVSLQPREHTNKWYNERYFKEDCYRNGGEFMTAGYLSIQRPVEILRKLLLVELLTCRMPGSMPECGFEWQEQTVPADGWLRLKENIPGLAMNSEVNLAGLDNYTNERALRLLFDDRLERFFEVNFKADPAEDSIGQVRNYLLACARDPQKGFYYIHAVTGPDGPLIGLLNGLRDNARRVLAELGNRERDWCNEGCQVSVKRGVITRVPEAVYEIAEQYLEPKFRRLQPRLELERLTEAIDYVAEYHKGLSQNYAEVTKVVEGFKAEAVRLMAAEESLFIESGNLDRYYVGLLRDVIKRDKKFDGIYARMWRAFENLSMYVAELESYISNDLMGREGFRRDVIEDLIGLYGGDAHGVYERIWEFIIEKQYFNILLKGGCKSLHSEINLFIDAAGMPARSAKAGRMNFFYEDNSESIDVVYHGGAFAGEDLYYDALYRGMGL